MASWQCSYLLHLPRTQLYIVLAPFLTSTSLAYRRELEVDFYRTSTPFLHLPRLQARAGGGFLSHFDTVFVSCTFSHTSASGGGFLSHFETAPASVAYKRKPEVDLYRFLTPFPHPLPPSHAIV